ncbi:hypothetical protein [Deinococcus misasensis]|uniref:hypothetical protein n=1 Tax=Deinococcus misasensis TaxID=392413 RepID=UPI0005589525|nr:hypothetical protein [Deinococcus misasensis]
MLKPINIISEEIQLFEVTCFPVPVFARWWITPLGITELWFSIGEEPEEYQGIEEIRTETRKRGWDWPHELDSIELLRWKFLAEYHRINYENLWNGRQEELECKLTLKGDKARRDLEQQFLDDFLNP